MSHTRKVTAIGAAVIIPEIKGVFVKPQRPPLSWAEREAYRLRRESAWQESGNWGTKRSAMGNDSEHGTDEDEPLPGEMEQVDLDTEHFLIPAIDQQLDQPGSSLTGRSIMAEVEEDFLNGRTPTFREGEPIGAIQHHRRGPVPESKTRNDIMNDRQKELRERQAENDRTLDRLKEKYR